MGVYIKGMEMPKRCIDCSMCHDYHYCLLLDKSFGEFDCTEYRWDYCPLVEVPPHGRLIDADDTENITVIMNDNGSGFNRIIAPTIIPAEEDEA